MIRVINIIIYIINIIINDIIEDDSRYGQCYLFACYSYVLCYSTYVNKYMLLHEQKTCKFKIVQKYNSAQACNNKTHYTLKYL